MASTSTFKLSTKHCGACNDSFDSDDARRAHSKTQWHVENLRRRVAGLSSLAAPAGNFRVQHRPVSSEAQDAGKKNTGDNENDAEEELSSSSESGDESATEDSDPEASKFITEQCLFCNEICGTFDDNTLHMQTTHGLFIRDLDHLAVDLETLVRYLHLVIFGYRECLYCQSQRRTVEAVQQHMSGKGHCKFSLQDPDSEYRDFFNFAKNPSLDSNSDGDGNADLAIPSLSNLVPHADDDSARLPSGRIVSHRIAGPAGRQQHRSRSQHTSLTAAPTALTPSTQSASPDSTKDDTQSLHVATRQEKRGGSLAGQLAKLSVNDRASLVHLSSAEQRSVLTTRMKQADKARRTELRHRSRVEMLGNKTLMKHFVPDVPGPKNG
ncbi:C2H2 type zinc-finger-domain-containing protein [Lasiosphaeris hirsuta]|uniref:C2H2 type zinc-finger-domain-containing protein n=1 Tax=Lasiosphaeris hirsuta TaxID=260670 RepID=A0AA40AQH9_9PEZI|nr:C2H2 type zinc-finger-domain-containing protein [Lasiosphaeris hirsuta]